MNIRQFMKYLLSLFLLLPLVFLSSCKEMVQPDPTFENLYGEWEWSHSSGGLAGMVLTPASEGYTITLEFSRDGIFTKFKDGKEIEHRFFEITEGESIYSQELQWQIHYYDKPAHAHPIPVSFELNGKELTLMEECYDCFSNYYVKK